MLIAAHGCSPEEAFQILSRSSQDTNRKVRDIAEAMSTVRRSDSRQTACQPQKHLGNSRHWLGPVCGHRTTAASSGYLLRPASRHLAE